MPVAARPDRARRRRLALRLARLVRRLGSPEGAGPEYGAWLDATRTDANLTRLASDAYFAGDEGRADALSAQAARTAKAAQSTARRLGLTDCARGAAAADPSATRG